jgi:hypothetical protein
MKRGLLVLALSAVLVTPAFAANHPSLQLVQRAPLTVRGTGFQHQERVTVSDGSSRLRVRTSASGAFSAQFPFADRCSGGQVVATGRSGERAVLHIPRPLCLIA